MISSLYYSEFEGQTFVIQAEADAVENDNTMLAILESIRDLLDHSIRIVLVFGKGSGFEKELRTQYRVQEHPETNRLVIPEQALLRIREERARIAQTITGLCQSAHIPYRLLPESAVRAERRIGHESTGVIAKIDTAAIHTVLDQKRLALIGFGGADDRGQFLHIAAASLAADLAVELTARKLLFLTKADGIFLPDHKGAMRQLSFADLEELLCLLQRKDPAGNLILSGSVVPKVHASIRAVAGNVSQIHLVSYSRLLEEVLTRTGVGTMIERQQSHQVDFARRGDLEEILRIHSESQRYTTPDGTPLVKPLTRAEIERLLPHMLLLKHRGIIVGKLHATAIPEAPAVLQIGGFVIGEDHQDSQHGQLLLSEALGRLRGRGFVAAAAVTASEPAKRVFHRLGGVPRQEGPWQSKLLEKALPRYKPQEQDQVELFEFKLD
jgi:acetylglutamate kinase